ncbi:MAG: 3-hydroxyacyl-ACP dehydratase FabZ [Alphaproteobacteria bacterium]|nr:3-hydroxyacyl-ACP dehydratase FabZ [Alphaproteobacteria bacterium]
MDGNTEKKHAATRSEIDLEGIKMRIPHRDPMLLLDSVIDVIQGTSCTGIKHLTAQEPYFAGHFPQRPIMPGVLIIEAMAQTAATLVVDSLYNGRQHNDLVYFMAIEKAHFRKPVLPGDTLLLKVKKDRQRGNVWRFHGKAYVGEALCADALFTAMLAPEVHTVKGG